MKSMNDSSDHLIDTALNSTQLLGDDFFLSILTSELNFPLTRSKSMALLHFYVANVCSNRQRGIE